MKDKVDLYSNIRVICTLLVVVGHCTNLGLVDSNGYDIIAYTNSVQIVTEYIREIIYSFHMPLFVSLSGAVFYLTFDDSKSFSSLVCKKAKKLLVPFYVVGLTILIPVRYFIGYYQNTDVLNTIGRDILMAYDVNYLWYLMMLFQVSVLFYLIQKMRRFRHSAVVIGAVLFAVSVSSYALPTMLFQVNRVLEFSFWFFAGMLIEEKRKQLNGKKADLLCMFLIMMWLIAFMIFGYLDEMPGGKKFRFEVKIFKMCVRYIMEMAAVICVYVFFAKHPMRNTRISELIENYSMDIYLLHVPVIYIYKKVLALCTSKIVIPNFLYTFFLILGISIAIVASLFLSRLSRIFTKK